MADDPTSPPLLFDWTVLEAAAAERGNQIVTVVATSQTDQQIPDYRRDLWEQLVRDGAVRIEYVAPGWLSGALRRTRAARLGDVLVVIGGGEGVEHLAEEYVRAGKPVIPLDLDIGASTSRGQGGAVMLARQAAAAPDQFFRLRDGHSPGTLLTATFTRQGSRSVGDVVAAILQLAEAIEDPPAFYVRLLDHTIPAFVEVERFFRSVVDPTIAGLGFHRVELGRDQISDPFLNAAIFIEIAQSSLVLVDLTAVRPNCMLEFGFALGLRKPFLLTAMEGQPLPFDTAAIECHFWSLTAADDRRRRELVDHYERVQGRRPIGE
jgi:hypothetical protein